MPISPEHKAGFVSIIGKPNVGKSTLMNALIGQKLSITTSKAQTTRHRIFGILTGEYFQLVYSDTPGVIDPQYPLQKSMMNFVSESLQDADVILAVADSYDDPQNSRLTEIIRHVNVPKILVINKVDLLKQEQVETLISGWTKALKFTAVIPVSALNKFNLDSVLETILDHTPGHPPYFPDGELSDKTERFFAAETIREKIFLNYKKEVPYSTEVKIDAFSEEKDIVRIRAIIYVERDSQKGIIIGKGGAALKQTGMEARRDIEAFMDKKVFLETHVKVEQDWRKREIKLKRFGY